MSEWSGVDWSGVGGVGGSGVERVSDDLQLPLQPTVLLVSLDCSGRLRTDCGLACETPRRALRACDLVHRLDQILPLTRHCHKLAKRFPVLKLARDRAHCT